MAHWQRLHILVTCRITFDHHVLNLDGITMKQTRGKHDNRVTKKDKGRSHFISRNTYLAHKQQEDTTKQAQFFAM